jgi:antitoxin ParD1/3/4
MLFTSRSVNLAGMKVSLTPQLQKFIEQRLKTGMYETASEVVREGLRLLKERDDADRRRLDALRADIAIGVAQADEGVTRPLDKSTFERIRRNGRAKLTTRAGARSRRTSRQ